MVEISQQAIENEIDLMQKEKTHLQELIAKKQEKSKQPLSVSELQILSEEIEGYEKSIKRIDFILKSLAEQGKIAGSKLIELKVSELMSQLDTLDINLHEMLREKLLLLERISDIEKKINRICAAERHDLVTQLQQYGKTVPVAFGSVHINLLIFDITNSFANLIAPLSFKDYIVDIDAAIKKIKERI